ncbi:sensor histidine kinase [Pseudomonas saudiphocaensis]|uniref:sensor histidine kinase n=1 Tax=Pseudomonas saudiphocaensis TaxID=1499686 RepID=UPI001FD00B36|nr:HAMP domain-containing sensor histidine kinase [Pseudomonas saudiphocaensis]
MGTDLLERRITDSRSLNIVRAIRQSTLRMGNLIEDVLDFARGKLGGGIPVDRSLVDDLQDHLAAVVLELRLAHPGAVIIDSMHVPAAVFCDPRRLAQSLSNLLGNAITHGAKNEPIQVRASSTAEQLTLSVHNMGPVIAPAMLPFLFRPFKRSEAGQREEGLGLGLYIASEIFTSHGGTLQVTSTFAEGTKFVATIPLTQRM